MFAMTGPIAARLHTGDRFEAGKCELIRLSSYLSKIMDQEVTKWRHVFETADKERLVYTGDKIVAAEEGRMYNVKATVKRFEPAYGTIRISRPIITRVDERQGEMM